MKPSLGSAIGRDVRMSSRASVTVRLGFCRRRYAITTVTERDFPIALMMVSIIYRIHKGVIKDNDGRDVIIIRKAFDITRKWRIETRDEYLFDVRE